MVLTIPLFCLTILVHLPCLHVPSSHVITDPICVEYQRSTRSKLPDDNLILPEFSDYYMQGDCHEYLYIIQGKDHAAINSGWGLPKGKVKNQGVDYVKRVQAVTAAQIRQVARKYLVEDNLTIATLLPEQAQALTGLILYVPCCGVVRTCATRTLSRSVFINSLQVTKQKQKVKAV